MEGTELNPKFVFDVRKNVPMRLLRTAVQQGKIENPKVKSTYKTKDQQDVSR
jgi:hypothetical protein